MWIREASLYFLDDLTKNRVTMSSSQMRFQSTNVYMSHRHGTCVSGLVPTSPVRSQNTREWKRQPPDDFHSKFGRRGARVGLVYPAFGPLASGPRRVYQSGLWSTQVPWALWVDQSRPAEEFAMNFPCRRKPRVRRSISRRGRVSQGHPAKRNHWALRGDAFGLPHGPDGL